MQQPGKETDSQIAKATDLENKANQIEPSKQKTKQHKEIQIRTLDDNKLKELSEAVQATIEVLTFRLENKGIFDAQGIHFSSALRLFAGKGAKKLRIYLTNNPVTHNTLEEICKNLKSYLPSLVHLVFQLDQTLVNDQGITYIFDMLKEIGQFLKVFEISLTGTQVTENGMSDLFQSLKFLPLECDVFVGNEDSETLQTLAKEFSGYQKFQRMLQKGQESGSEEDEEEDESDEDNLIKIRNLEEEEGSDEETDNKKKKKKKEKEKKKNKTKKKKGVLRTTKQQNQFGQFPQFTPQMLAGINPMVLQQMYSQMMQQQRMPMNNKMMMNPFMWQQQNQLLMQNMMMRGMGQQQPRGQQQPVQQGQKFPLPGFPAQQQFTPQMMQQQTQAFSQLQKNIKEMQKNQNPGEQKKTEGDEKIMDKQEKKKEDETQIKQEPQQQQQQKPNPNSIDPNVLKNMMQQQQQQQQQQQFLPPPQPQQFQQPKQQVGDFQLILDKLRSQQAILQQQQQQQNQKPLQQEQSNIQKTPETIGKPVQAIPPGFKQKSMMDQQQQQNAPPPAQTQPQQQQKLQQSIEQYFTNLQQPQQQNQQQTLPKENMPVNVPQDQQYSQFFNFFEKNQKFDNEKFNNQFQSLNFFQQLKDEKNKSAKQNED